MSHWSFVLAAYSLAATVLLVYWWRVERRIRTIEALPESRGKAGRRP